MSPVIKHRGLGKFVTLSQLVFCRPFTRYPNGVIDINELLSPWGCYVFYNTAKEGSTISRTKEDTDITSPNCYSTWCLVINTGTNIAIHCHDVALGTTRVREEVLTVFTVNVSRTDFAG